ncbi:MAG: hypothetical protein LBL49_09770 [Clostridiales Family XIII bacterium]|jgi:hypothetical protein|nr:hypothetical protein [Clostridiales Family XIII bacterium]
MFLYWDGFEIDGSDTDFDIVLPENVQTLEFVERFLSIPIFSRDMEPSYAYIKNRKSHSIDLQELREILLSGNFPRITIDINCMNIDRLSEDLRAEIYAISERREPHEEAYGKVELPCTAPLLQKFYTRGDMTVELAIEAPKTAKPAHDHGGEEREFDGYVYNVEFLRAAKWANQSFQINVGPGFFYEYAMFIIDYMRNGFPGIGISGGLDCEGGWTDGCTYASSIYRYEKIQIPAAYGVKHILKRLTAYNIVQSYRCFYGSGLQYECTYGFYLANHAPYTPGEKLSPLPFGEYVSLVETALSLGNDSFTEICDTAVDILLPMPDVYSESPDAVSLLQAAMPTIDGRNPQRYFTGYLAFTLADGVPVCEFRVNYQTKKYLQTLLDLMESGEIDFIKAITYEARVD